MRTITIMLVLLATEVSSQKVYWCVSGFPSLIMRANLDGTDPEVVLDCTAPWYVEIDKARSQIFWVEDFGSSYTGLWSAGIDGSVPSFKYSDFVFAGGTAVTQDHVYWMTSSTSGAYIRRAASDVTGVETVAVVEPAWGLELDEARGKLYWLEIIAGQIMRSNLDGTGAELVIDQLVDPWALALDLVEEKVYWFEDVSMLARTDLTGGAMELVMPVFRIFDMEIDALDRKIYYTDSVMEEVLRVDMDTQVVEVIAVGTHARGIALDLRSGVCGDCALDGDPPSILDALAAARIAVGLLPPSPQQLSVCDVSGYGGVSSLDVLLLAQASIGLPVVFICN